MSYAHLKVTLTPQLYDGVYGDEADVTSDIDITALIRDNLGEISREVDNGDFDFGVFVFGGLTLKCFNDGGRFSPSTDPRSLFTYSRDLAIVKLQYVDASGVSSLLFEGLINEDTAKDEDLPEADLNKASVSFKVLSMDSVFRHVPIVGGTIESGILFSDAIKQILNTTRITNILDYDPARISTPVDLTIDDGNHFTGMSVKEALDDLLLAAHAVLIVDDDRKITVKAREHNDTVHYFYAPHDPLGRGNILKITGFNSGLQRAFSAVKINDTELLDADSQSQYGYRQKSIDCDFVTGTDKEETIGGTVLDEFKIPRAECIVHVPFSDARNVKLFDQVSIDYPLRLTPPQGEDAVTMLPVDLSTPIKLSRESGAFEIPAKIRWKVIGIGSTLRKEIMKIKVRQIGVKYGDETIDG